VAVVNADREPAAERRPRTARHPGPPGGARRPGRRPPDDVRSPHIRPPRRRRPRGGELPEVREGLRGGPGPPPARDLMVATRPEHDLVVIGTGPRGYVGARRGAHVR